MTGSLLLTVVVQQLFIQMTRILWAFNIEAGISDQTGVKNTIDDIAGSEGFIFVPKPFKTVCTPRGPWVRNLVEEQGTTHSMDYGEVLDQAGRDRMIKIDKAR